MASELKRIYAIFRHSQSTLHCSRDILSCTYGFLLCSIKEFFPSKHEKKFFNFSLKALAMQIQSSHIRVCCFNGKLLASESKKLMSHRQNPLKVLRVSRESLPGSEIENDNSILHPQPTFMPTNSIYFYH